MKSSKKWFYIIAIAVVILDQLAKFFVVQNIEQYGELTLIPNLLSLTHTLNSGIIFGIFFQNNNAIVIISLMLVCLMLVWVILHSKGKIKADYFHTLTFLAFYLVIGGAISNILDRIFRVAVIDYISLDFWNFPIFNIADIAITAGAVLLIWEILFSKKIIKNTDDTEPSATQTLTD